jgi:hypothetical protein
MTKQILQEGNFVSVDSKGARASVPMGKRPSNATPKRLKTGGMGTANRGNAAGMEAAGMKDGGLVKSRAKSTPYSCK